MACLIEGWGDDAAFATAVMRKARKEHACCECGRVILKGEEYEHAFGKWGGRAEAFATCRDCLSLRDAFFCSWTYGNVWNEFAEWAGAVGDFYVGELDGLARLTPAARDRAIAIIGE